MVADLLKGRPVITFRRGQFPNRLDIVDVQARFPNMTVRTEVSHAHGTRFVVTVAPRKA